MKNTLILLTILLGLFSCAGESTKKTKSQGETSKENNVVKHEEHIHVKDTHSAADPTEAFSKHLSLDIEVFFDVKSIVGTATYDIVASDNAKEIVYDIDKLDIKEVKVDGKAVDFKVNPKGDFGGNVRIPISPESKKVAISYASSPEADAVQWLNPQQTLDKKHPFLFTQGQAILTRSWIPIQDSPGIRITYDAKVKVPTELMAVMSASNPQERSTDGVYTFEMKQAIPPYLVALAVGDVYFGKIGARTGVYAEKSMLDKAVYELGDMEKMVEAAEGLYGDYVWDRFDVIVLPPSFPFGGMENPRLTFATPTIIVGDRSLTSLIAHELAHSWSGNLVTNSTWDDFWLNEGFTVYFEYRIMEELYGKDYTDMLRSLGRQDLDASINGGELPAEDTHLKLSLEGRNPDDGMTDIAYEKGRHFLEMLEAKVGREKFDVFLKSYFTTHAFQNMTTERFVEILEEELLSKNPDVEVNYKEWIYGPGLPDNAPNPQTDRFAKVSQLFKDWKDGKTKASDINTEKWSTQEWMHFLREIPNENITLAQMKQLDDAFNLTNSKNPEIQDIWYEKAVYNNYEAAYDAMSNFLQSVGRRKFLTPLYKAMKNSGKLELAKSIYEKARPNYHSVSVGTMDELLGYSQ